MNNKQAKKKDDPIKNYKNYLNLDIQCQFLLLKIKKNQKHTDHKQN